MTAPSLPLKAPPKRRRGLVTTLEHPVPPPVGQYRWVYLWHLPLRVTHWLSVLSIGALTLTGFYIGRPYFLSPSTVVSGGFAMGWARLLHFVFAAVLVMSGIMRFYLLFSGNRYERFASLFPVRGRDWVNLVKQVKFYLMIQPEKAPHYLGHNPLQQFAYTAVYGVALLMVLTGFVMYGQSNPDGFIHGVFGWMAPWMGGLQTARLIHHVATWFFILFFLIHLYLALRADSLERSGTVSSIFSGGRFVSIDQHFIDG